MYVGVDVGGVGARREGGRGRKAELCTKVDVVYINDVTLHQ